MKRKGLLFVATLLLSVFSLCLVACNEPHEHDYKIEKSETMHWLKCDCGDIKDFNVHGGGTATCVAKAVCEECGQSYGDYLEHSIDSSGFCSVCELPMTATEGLVIEKSTDGTYAQVIGYTGTSTKVNIPSTYDNLPVKSISHEAFVGKSITKVIIPDSVTIIGGAVFAYCSSLTSITVDDNNLVYKSIDGNVYSKDGKELVSYAIGKTATSFTIPNSVTNIGAYAFISCSSLTSIEIPNNVISIGVGAFGLCTSLTSVTLGNSVTSIGERAFTSCSSLKAIEIPNSVASIGALAFSNCTSLTSVTIPNSVTSIDDGAFSGCYSLQSVTFVENSKLTSIGKWAFENCESLQSIEIPSSVTSIGAGAFYGCSSLTSVIFKDTTTWYKIETFHSDNAYENWQNKTGGTEKDVTDISKNAEYLKYYNYYWYKI